MQWKVSSLAAITSLLLLSAGDLVLLVVAQISAPICTVTGWTWAFNSLDQTPCTVTAYLMSTCYGGAFDMNSLGVDDTGYSGPSTTEYEAAGPCWCNTVIYSLMSACSECQGGESIAWSLYVEDCITVEEPSTFPNPVPAGTSVPYWALVEISGTSFWSPTTAQEVGDAPEVIAGELIDTPVFVPTPTYTVVPTFTTPTVVLPEPTITEPSESGGTEPGGLANGSNQGASVGGVLRGVTIIVAIAALSFV